MTSIAFCKMNTGMSNENDLAAKLNFIELVVQPEWSGSWTEPKDKSVFFSGDSEASDSLDKCLECMHAEEICVIPYRSESFDQEVCVASERDLKCEVELLCFSKVCQVTVL